jgi:cation diffusion facilitator family transporter
MTPTRAAGISVLSNIFVIGIEVTAGVLTGSVAIIAGAANSLLDLIAALIAVLGLRVAYRPPDHGHPFGHGKAENVAAFAEGILILVGAGWVIYEAVGRLVTGVKLEFLEVGMGVMLVSVTVNFAVSRFLFRMARRHDSLALEADARHLVADIYTSLGVVVSLVLVRLTGFELLDPIVALGVALLILKAAWDVGRKTFPGLVDARLPKEEERVIVDTIVEHYRQFIDFHELRTRHSGRTHYVELHLTLAAKMSLEEAHKLCDHLEKDIQARLPNTEVTIHCEPPEKEPASGTTGP